MWGWCRVNLDSDAVAEVAAEDDDIASPFQGAHRESFRFLPCHSSAVNWSLGKDLAPRAISQYRSQMSIGNQRHISVPTQRAADVVAVLHVHGHEHATVRVAPGGR